MDNAIRNKIFDLCDRGFSIRQIAEEVGYGKSRVGEILNGYVPRQREVAREYVLLEAETMADLTSVKARLSKKGEIDCPNCGFPLTYNAKVAYTQRRS